ncbi:MAG: glycolate oxidase subunit GlcE [Gammaproteobacteria bacterium]
MTSDITEIRSRLQQASAERRTLEILGGGSKRFLGREPLGSVLELAGHRGIVDYQPSELMLTARAGTPLQHIESLLTEQGQMLAFEPPHFGATATLGGTIACGLSGPRRPYVGAARDFVLGVVCLSANGERLTFGGQVMKNVAGFDISRLMAGAMGTLGVLLEISLKVLPRPETEATVARRLPVTEALDLMNHFAGRPLPISAASFDGENMLLRLSGVPSAVAAAEKTIGGDRVPDGEDHWHKLREHELPFFYPRDKPLWRLSLPPASSPLDLAGEWLFDWGGAQRWLRTDADPTLVRQTAVAAGGHATLFRGGDRSGEVFTPLPLAMWELHQRLKQAFDPHGIFNRGRLYPAL